MKMMLNGLVLSAAVGLLWMTGCASEGTVVVREAPPAPRADVVVVQPGPRYAWVPGHWAWQGQWVWVPGRWRLAPNPTAVWVPGHWVRYGEGYVWTAGHWR
jgi:hypothetical protein